MAKLPPQRPNIPIDTILYDYKGWIEYARAIEAEAPNTTGFGASCVCNQRPMRTGNGRLCCKDCGDSVEIKDVKAALGYPEDRQTNYSAGMDATVG